MIVPVGRSELKRIYKKHYAAYKKLKAGNGEFRSRQLLLVYAVECGLKYLWLIKNNANTLCDHKKVTTHDINYLQKTCNLPNLKEHMIPAVVLKDKTTVNVGDLHQLYRYGIQVTDESKLMKIEDVLCRLYIDVESVCAKYER